MTSHYAPDQANYYEPEFTQGDRLRKARETAGLSQEQLAAELGVSKNTISNYETGNVKPRHPTLLAWSMRTRVSLGWLKGEAARPGGRTPTTRPVPPPGLEPGRMAYIGTDSFHCLDAA